MKKERKQSQGRFCYRFFKATVGGELQVSPGLDWYSVSRVAPRVKGCRELGGFLHHLAQGGSDQPMTLSIETSEGETGPRA